MEALEQALVPLCLLQHARSDIQGDHQRVAIFPFQQGSGPTRTRSQIEHDAGPKREGLEPAQQLVGHIRLQHGGGLISRAGAIERAAHRARIEIEGVRFGHSAPASTAAAASTWRAQMRASASTSEST